MSRITILFLALIGHSILVASAAKIPISHFKTLLYREPPLLSETISPQAPVLEYIEQNVDNFNPTNDATYRMVCRPRNVLEIAVC